jgi:hypothetical protein
MAVKHKTLYLYLTLACFLGIILIFIFDGYMGLYDSLTVKSQEIPNKFEADFWVRPYNQASAWVEHGGTMRFNYEVDNRRFSAYQADIEVSLWRVNEKIAVILAKPVSVAAFDKTQFEWFVDTAKIVPVDFPANEQYFFTVVIKMGEIERRIVTTVQPVRYSPGEIKIPAPPR